MDYSYIGKGLLRSKKFQIALGSAIVAGLARWVEVPNEVIVTFLGLAVTAIVGQAVADTGKHAAEINAAVALAEIAAYAAVEKLEK